MRWQPRWLLCDLDGKTREEFDSFGHWFPAELNDTFANTLWMTCLPREPDSWLSEGREVAQHGPLVTLPAELLNMVIKELSPIDTALLAVTCKKLLLAAEPFLLRHHHALWAPWAGHRLILLDNDLRCWDDLPPGLLTADERDKINCSGVVSVEHADSHATSDEQPFKFRPWLRATCADQGRVHIHEWTDCIKQMVESKQEMSYQAVGGSDKRIRWVDVPSLARRDILMFGALVPSDPTHAQGEPLLCNISKGVYVRAGSLLDIGSAGDTPASLWHVLATHICWSNSTASISTACSQEYLPQLMQGSWAGDRFCVVTKETMPKLGEDMVWKDVSEEVKPILKHLWEENDMRWSRWC